MNFISRSTKKHNLHYSTKLFYLTKQAMLFGSYREIVKALFWKYKNVLLSFDSEKYSDFKKILSRYQFFFQQLQSALDEAKRLKSIEPKY